MNMTLQRERERVFNTSDPGPSENHGITAVIHQHREYRQNKPQIYSVPNKVTKWVEGRVNLVSTSLLTRGSVSIDRNISLLGKTSA